jgi:hypothetical protein
VSTARKWTRALALLAGLAAGKAAAQPAAADDLATILATHDVIYDGIAWERHSDTGRLVLRSFEGPTGGTSLGEWRIEEGARCLRWTRAMDWECYQVTLDGAGGITFTDTGGNRLTGRLVPR